MNNILVSRDHIILAGVFGSTTIPFVSPLLTLLLNCCFLHVVLAYFPSFFFLLLFLFISIRFSAAFRRKGLFVYTGWCVLLLQRNHIRCCIPTLCWVVTRGCCNWLWDCLLHPRLLFDLCECQSLFRINCEKTLND